MLHTATVLYRHWQWNFFALWRQKSDQKCLKFWHLICWSSEKPAKAPFTKTKISILWTVQCTEIVFQQKEKMESSRSNPDVWPCYSVFMCHHTTTSQTLQITPDISHPPGDLKKFNILNILSKFIKFYCRTKGGWKVWKVGFFSISVLTLQLTNLFVLLEGWEVSRTELEKWIYFSLFSPNLSTAIHTYRD